MNAMFSRFRHNSLYYHTWRCCVRFCQHSVHHHRRSVGCCCQQGVLFVFLFGVADESVCIHQCLVAHRSCVRWSFLGLGYSVDSQFNTLFLCLCQTPNLTSLKVELSVFQPSSSSLPFIIYSGTNLSALSEVLVSHLILPRKLWGRYWWYLHFRY